MLDINFKGNALAENSSNSLVVDVSSNQTISNDTISSISTPSLDPSAVIDALSSVGFPISNQSEAGNLSNSPSVK